MKDAVIDIRNVRKDFGRKVHALRGVSLRVGAGEVFGLLGPNGAGKSTLVKILLTIVRPTQAEGTLLGQPLGRRGPLAQVGYLPENLRFPAHLRGRQVLEHYAALAKVPRAVRRRRAAELLERVGMSSWGDTPASRYSKGMLQRLGIAQALMNDPKLVFLDEPTDGLDPLGRRDVRHMLADLTKRGKTVFLNSHILSELEMICDRVSILVQGQVAREGTIAQLTEHSVTYRITVAGGLDGVAAEVRKRGGVIDGNAISVAGRDAAAVNQLIDVLRGAGVLIESVTPQRFSLEDVFVEAVHGRGVGAALEAER
ncbi:MAG: ABC transporter ATP-binding protein [Phycisphaerae bacterium]|nr:ABC transporter ATP-binding protein [Phycisphaerae bacterium]MCZ2401096.1 ABC transporter ATP-binding protein [Phycisphaerae bacterium]